MDSGAVGVPHVAIIGAGCSGLAAARTLLKAGWKVTIFEKEQAVGGRVTTRRRGGFIYDSGAQNIKPGNADCAALIRESTPPHELVDIRKPVWVFDQAGTIREGDPLQNVEARWTWRYGLATLVEGMADGVDVQLGVEIVGVIHGVGHRGDKRWTLLARNATNEAPTSHGLEYSGFSHLIISIPMPQAMKLMRASDDLPEQRIDNSLSSVVDSYLQRARYNPLISVALGYAARSKERLYYAIVNTDRGHAIGWLAWEHEKTEERAPDGMGLLIAQMGAGYSREQWSRPREEVIRDVAARVSALIGEELALPIMSDVEYWPLALPYELT